MPGTWTNRAATPDEALAYVRSGMRIFVHGAAATPTPLLEALARRSDLADVKLFHMHTQGPAPSIEPEHQERFFSISLFVGAPLRKSIDEGRADFVPVEGSLRSNRILQKASKPSWPASSSAGGLAATRGDGVLVNNKVAWAVTTLVGNARRYMRSGSRRMGGGTINLRAGFDPTRSQVTIEVEDDGPGTPADTVTRLFRRDGLNVGGAGLALLLMSDICAAHGGTVDVHSHTDLSKHGTTVRLTLPAR